MKDKTPDSTESKKRKLIEKKKGIKSQLWKTRYTKYLVNDTIKKTIDASQSQLQFHAIKNNQISFRCRNTVGQALFPPY